MNNTNTEVKEKSEDLKDFEKLMIMVSELTEDQKIKLTYIVEGFLLAKKAG